MGSSSEKSKPGSKPFTVVAVIIFSIISSLHLFRFFFGWEVVLNGMHVPVWVSVFGFVIPALLAVMLWKEMQI